MGDMPKARSGHSITKIEGGTGGSYVMYGGILDQGSNTKIQPTNEVYKLSVKIGKANWEKV